MDTDFRLIRSSYVSAGSKISIKLEGATVMTCSISVVPLLSPFGKVLHVFGLSIIYDAFSVAIGFVTGVYFSRRFEDLYSVLVVPRANHSQVMSLSDSELLLGKLALITGCTGGIGQATARSLARKGINIAVHYNAAADTALSLVEELRSLGVNANAFQASIRSSQYILIFGNLLMKVHIQNRRICRRTIQLRRFINLSNKAWVI